MIQSKREVLQKLGIDPVSAAGPWRAPEMADVVSLLLDLAELLTDQDGLWNLLVPPLS